MASTVHPQHKTWGDGSLLALAVAARYSKGYFLSAGHKPATITSWFQTTSMIL